MSSSVMIERYRFVGEFLFRMLRRGGGICSDCYHVSPTWTASSVSAEPAYDYVFRGPPGDTSAPSSSLKLTSSPVRLRSKGEWREQGESDHIRGEFNLQYFHRSQEWPKGGAQLPAFIGTSHAETPWRRRRRKDHLQGSWDRGRGHFTTTTD